MSGASFVYPAGGNFSNVAPNGLVNLFDTLEVSYSSSWDALNLTLFCLVGDVASDYAVWQVPTNPISPTGSYRLSSISDTGFNIVKYPTLCSFKLTQYGDNDIARGGENFQLVSDPSTSTTYHLTSTLTPLATATPDSQGTATVSDVQVASTASSLASETAASSSTETQTAKLDSSSLSSGSSNVPRITTTSASSSSTLTAGSLSQEGGLSTGAKVGISIGVVILLAVIAALCFVIIRLRKKATGPPPETVHNTTFQPALPAYTYPTDKSAYVYNMHELEHTDRVELPNQPRRIRPGELE